ncbi:MAG: Restriction modification system DNA specificity domain [Parcubacteria bacterium 32_520]|nr:MAG: Restriction modification system DNA specificity domain [Parcubacteria bacterium 32_520]
MVDSELGKIPEGWEVRSILDSPYFHYINESCPKYEGAKEYLATANIEGINIIKKGEWVSYSEKPSRAQKIPKVYSVWFSKMKESYKVLGFTEENQCFANRYILSSGFDGFRTSKEFFAFLYCVIKSKYFHQKRDQYCTGAVQISLTKKGLESIKIIIPSKNIILRFNEIILPMINQIIVSQQKNNCLKNIRDLLLPKLISGTIDVSDLDIKTEEKK